MEHTIELNDTPILCIICLEDLDIDIMEVCDKCDIRCHIKCLYDWYIKNNDELCPICLKKTYCINNTVNELFNNQENINNIEGALEGVIEEINDNIQEIYDNETSEQIDRVMMCVLCTVTFSVSMVMLFL